MTTLVAKEQFDSTSPQDAKAYAHDENVSE